MAVTKSFILAGDATFTIEVPEAFRKEKAHYTFRVQHVEANDRWPESYFVKILTGPENTSDYSYLGKLDPAAATVYTTAKSAMDDDSYPVRLLNRTLAMIWTDQHDLYEKHGFRTHHEGKCGRCGRKLTVPESIESGIGPECAKIMGHRMPEPEDDSCFVSDHPGLDTSKLTPHRDAEGELTHWTGKVGGRMLTVFND